ncbi:hypothetical protein KOR42_22270 [Thalassoglobus neptunius]|uniref:DUF1559 domain-containing protein n=1 Tax=Thalassoglobus neptunius TaxID=1938619 RepID=A0A5C5X7C5_9PLAN|nr:hypothetical protein KOR42_22270 [Thalassoglobus neptunius]
MVGTFPPGRIVYPGTSSTGSPTGVVTGFLAMILPQMEGSNLSNIYDQKYGFDDPFNQEAVNTIVPEFLCPSAPGDRVMPIYAGWNMGWTTDVNALPGVTGVASDYFGVRGMHYVDENGVHLFDGSAGVLNEKGTKIGHITDGSSNTILLYEMAGKGDHWKLGRLHPPPTNAQFYSYGPWSGNNGVGVYNWSDDGLQKGCDGCTKYINVDNEASPYSFHVGTVHVMMADGSTRSLSENIDSEVFVNLAKSRDGNIVGEF